MKARAARRLGLATLLVPTLAVLGVACSYDFDRFVREQAGASGAGETSAAGRAGASGTSSALGGHGGGGVAGGTNAKSGAAGALDEAGAGGSDATGGSGGTAGLGANGGSPNGGTSSDAGAGGKPSGKGGGSGNASGGKAGSVSNAGQAGQSSAGAGGAGASCTGSGATAYGGHCYFLVGDDTPLDWSSAKSACAAHASTTHLVTVGSKEEQQALATAFFPSTVDTWIGLSLDDVTKDPSSLCKLSPDQCPFKWVTSEKLDYTDWTVRSGTDSEPNYTGACVRMQATDQTWGDTPCSGKLRAICEDGG